MSKKFLSESQVRRFQGLAGIPSIHQEAGYFGDRDEDELPGARRRGTGGHSGGIRSDTRSANDVHH